ncbi:spore cortex-lytic enzyme [Bacillus piscicola]|uniref:spore cortex-lytic enzyme n=1 Tax=Bacillus piscicola TaxID=1632684 RepID=UPI001F0901DF|nr:spore cortex-lytic enzyme [Bacillus piscicola]
MKVSNIIPITIISMIISLAIPTEQTHAFSDQVIQKGATGDDVVELQARLQHNGFYNGTIDGVFGWGTYWAVKNFQEEFGLEEVDGLVGDKMKAMLEKSTEYDEAHVKDALRNARKFTNYGGTPKGTQKGPKGSAEQPSQQKQAPQPKQEKQAPQPNEQPNQQKPAPQQEQKAQQPQQPAPGQAEEQDQPQQQNIEEQSDDANIQKAMNVPAGYSENDIQIISNAVHGEARGEPYIGQVAVAAVILNRVNSPSFPNTASGVIFEPRAFTAVSDGQIYMKPNEQARKAVLDAINGQDPSNGALYYYNPAKTTSNWIYSRPTIKRIGKHVFAK